MLQKAIIATVDLCIRYARQATGIAVLLAVLSGVYAATHFRLDADINNLISKELPWRKREASFEAYFPAKEELILVVVDAPTSELVSEASSALVAKLSEQKQLFHQISEAGGGPFFEKNGLLFLPTEEVVETTRRLRESRRILQTLAQDPSLRGLSAALNYGLIGLRTKRFTLDEFAGTLNMVADTLDGVLAG